MRCFRLKCRVLKNKKVSNQRDYIGLDKLVQFGKETYDRYNQPESNYQPRVAELYEQIDGRWVKLNPDEVDSIFENEK